jgi:hypothetical protein
VTVGELVKLLQVQDEKKRVVVADRDGAGRVSEDIDFVDQRVERGEPVIALWIHR